MEIAELKKNMEKFIGKEVVIIGDHPHTGEKGITKEVKILMGKPAMLIEGDDGQTFFIFSAKNLFFVLSKTNVKDVKNK